MLLNLDAFLCIKIYKSILSSDLQAIDVLRNLGASDTTFLKRITIKEQLLDLEATEETLLGDKDVNLKG